MGDHLREIIEYVTSDGRTIGPFIAEQLRLWGERDVHFATVWLVNWLAHNAYVGYSGPGKLPPAPLSRALREMIKSSDQLSAVLVASAESLDYPEGLNQEVRERVERLAPRDSFRDADV